MLYTDSHEWISLSGHFGKVGISQYARGELGEIVYIELPKIGQVVHAGEEVCVLESTKAAADVYTPVSGVIVAVNEALRKEPQVLNQDPESAGWLFQIELSNLAECSKLMNPEEYASLI